MIKKLLGIFRKEASPYTAANDAVAKLRAAVGDDLSCVLIHGSLAGNEYCPGVSDINLLAVLNRLDLATNRKLRKSAGSWNRDRRVQVSFFSVDELSKASEAAPIQFLDMLDMRKLLMGEDPFRRLQINRKNLRSQVELEFRSKFYTWRSRLLGARPGELAAQLGMAAANLMPGLRGYLRLRGRRPGRERGRVLEEAGRMLELKVEVIAQALGLRYGKGGAADLDSLREALLAEMTLMALVAERMAAQCGIEGAVLGKLKQEAREPRAALPQTEAREAREPRGEGREPREGGRGGRERSEGREPRGEGGRDGGREGGRNGRHGRGEGREGGRNGRGGGGNSEEDSKKREKQLAEVKQLLEQDTRKKWEPKEPERFQSDAMSRDTSRPVDARFGWDRTWNKGEAGDKPVADAAGSFGWDKEWRARERRERLERRQKAGGAPEAGPAESLAGEALGAEAPEPVPQPVERPVEAAPAEVMAERPAPAPRPAVQAAEALQSEAPARPSPRPAAKPQAGEVQRLPEEKFNW